MLFSFLLKGQTADFSADVVSGCSPLTVQFSDESSGNPTGWNWNFGNGNTSNDQNPSATYITPGVYNVSLTLNNGNSLTKTAFITVYENPDAGFTADVQVGCTPHTVNFQDVSLAGDGNITEWLWVFGDGGTSTDQNPQYTYSTAGAYSVTLTVTNEFGCQNALTESNFITVSDLNANFQVDRDAVCETPATVNFTNLSTGPDPLIYNWDFGDGATSSERDPAHTYSSPGTYLVRLELSTSVCTSTDIYEVSIDVGSRNPEIDIPEISCTQQGIRFSVDNNADIVSWLWNFGDNSTSSLPNPIHVYAGAGDFTVALEVEYSDGCTGTNSKDISILNPPQPFFTSQENCDRGVTFSNTSNFADSYLWNFGDRSTSTDENPFHIYSNPGRYTVTLTASNEGCTRVFQQTIGVGNPITADFSPDELSSCDTSVATLGGCLPKTINFINESISVNGGVSFMWDFGDGSSSTESEPTHEYTTAGDFTVVLTATDQIGCTSTIEREVSVVAPEDRSVADFQVSKTEVCVLETITLTDNSDGKVDLWCWSLGNGVTISTDQPSLSYIYNEVGVYTVSLSVSYKGCLSESVLIKEDLITVLDPSPKFIYEKDCDNPFTITTTNTTQNSDSFLWSFGDGQTSTEANPVHTYSGRGTYVLSLSATNNSTACTVERFDLVTIYDLQADFEVSNTKVCLNESIEFTNLSSTDAVFWEWNFGDGRTLVTDEMHTDISYSTPGTYTIKLTAFDFDGCTDILEETNLITVADIRGDFQKSNTINYCDSLLVEFGDLSTAFPAIDEWKWGFGDGDSSSLQNPSHTYKDLGNYNVSLTLKNAVDECTITKSDAVTFTEPVPDFRLSRSAYCADDEITISNRSVNADSYQWFVNGDTIADVNPTVSFPERGEFNITLNAIDEDGCTNEIVRMATIQKPVASFEAQQISAECPPLTTTFASTSGDQVVRWDWSINNRFFSGLENPTNTFTVPGDYDVSLIVTDDIGCVDSIRIDEFVQLGGPLGTYEVNNNEGCLNQNVEFEAFATNTEKYIWDFGNGVVQETKSPRIEHQYTSSGVYTPNLILEDESGCQFGITEGDQVSIFDTTAVEFFIPQNYPFTGETVIIEHDGFPTGNLSWNMGDGSFIEGESPNYAYSEGGEFEVSLSFTNSNGCESEFRQTVFIQEDLILIPNVFTPNVGDKVNSTFDMLYLENGFWDLKVFNRNGKLVYTMDDYDGQWAANDLPTGVYYYTVVNQFREDKAYDGYVHVLK
ncbi:MAG: PKD domain-containing protein [Bacteroidota bacterium]